MSSLWDNGFDFNKDGKMDWLEKAMRAAFICQMCDDLEKEERERENIYPTRVPPKTYNQQVRVVEDRKVIIKTRSQYLASIEKKKTVYRNMPAKNLKLSIKAKKCLLKNGLNSVGEILDMQGDDFVNLDNMDFKTCHRIMIALQRIGVTYGDREHLRLAGYSKWGKTP